MFYKKQTIPFICDKNNSFLSWRKINQYEIINKWTTSTITITITTTTPPPTPTLPSPPPPPYIRLRTLLCWLMGLTEVRGYLCYRAESVGGGPDSMVAGQTVEAARLSRAKIQCKAYFASRASIFCIAGRIWPTGRRLPAPALIYA